MRNLRINVRSLNRHNEVAFCSSSRSFTRYLWFALKWRNFRKVLSGSLWVLWGPQRHECKRPPESSPSSSHGEFHWNWISGEVGPRQGRPSPFLTGSCSPAAAAGVHRAVGPTASVQSAVKGVIFLSLANEGPYSCCDANFHFLVFFLEAK